jgi:hypothetical protein
MRIKPRGFARSAAHALTVAAVAAGGVVVFATPAFAAVPTITSVFVAGSTTNKVVTTGTTVLITGVGFSGMTDNAATAACTVTPVANSGCSQVRFYGIGTATSTEGYTVATRYNVISDTQIYATVPAIPVATGAATPLGAAAIGTGSVKVQVVNTMLSGSSSLMSASAASELFYRHALTAAVVGGVGAVTANPLGGGTITVGVTPIPTITTTTLPQEKITAYFTSIVAGSPMVIAAPVAFKDGVSVSVTLPPGSPAGDYVGITLVHDGIAGVADVDSIKYPAVITKLESCTVDVTTVTALPAASACAGTATAPGTDGSDADIKITGKGLTGATDWDFNGTGGDVDPTCTVVSDTLAFCDLNITDVPSPAVAPVTFTPADPDLAGPATAPALVPTAGSILIYSSLV